MSALRRIIMVAAIGIGLCLSSLTAEGGGVRMHDRNSGGNTSSSDAVDSTVERPQFTVDRRPIGMLRVWEGVYAEHPLGLPERYRGEDISDALTADLDMLYDEGFRRIMLLMPTGAPSHLVLDRTLEEYSLRSATWRNSFSAAVKAWKRAHPDVRLGLYQGFRFRNSSYPNQSQLAQHLEPWIEMGIEEIGFDFSGATTSKETFLMAEAYLRSRGVRAFMEAYPRSSGTELDMEMLKGFPVMAAKAYHDELDPTGKWRFNPRLTEVHIQVGRVESEVSEAFMRDLVDRGMVLMAFSRNPTVRKKVLAAYGIESRPDSPVVENKRENRRRLRFLPTRRVHSR